MSLCKRPPRALCIVRSSDTGLAKKQNSNDGKNVNERTDRACLGLNASLARIESLAFAPIDV